VTSTSRSGSIAAPGGYKAGWIASFVLHGTLAFGAFMFTQQIRLAPQPTPFQWNVSMVAPKERAMPSPVTTPHPAPPAENPPVLKPRPQTSRVQPVASNQQEPTRVAPSQPATLMAEAPLPSFPPPQQQPSVVEPAPPIPTAAAPATAADPVMLERTAVRPIDPSPQPAPPEPPAIAPHREPIAQTESRPVSAKPPAPTTTPPAPVSAPASEPAIATTRTQPLALQSSPNEITKPVAVPAPKVSAIAPAVSKPAEAASPPMPPATQSAFFQAAPPVAVSTPHVATNAPAEREPARLADSTSSLATQNPQMESTASASKPAPQVAAIPSTPQAASTRRDYSWLSDTISRRVEELKRYPAEARLDRAEGKVVIKAVLRADGSVDDVEVFQSSGYQTLDQAAVELIKRAAPFQLPRPLGKSQMTVKIPMSYRLEQ